MFAEQLFGHLLRPIRPRFQLAVRCLLYFGAAIVGFGLAFPIAGLVVFRRLILVPMQFPPVVSAVTAMLIATAIYSYTLPKQRLEESLVRIKEQEFAERELELARSIQQRLLPPPSIEGDGYRVVARNIPATYVAGDFYDVFHHADGWIAARQAQCPRPACRIVGVTPEQRTSGSFCPGLTSLRPLLHDALDALLERRNS